MIVLDNPIPYHDRFVSSILCFAKIAKTPLGAGPPHRAAGANRKGSGGGAKKVERRSNRRACRGREGDGGGNGR